MAGVTPRCFYVQNKFEIVGIIFDTTSWVYCRVGSPCPTEKFPVDYGQAQVRVSGGHLCEAEAPTEPAGETYLPLQCSKLIEL